MRDARSPTLPFRRRTTRMRPSSIIFRELTLQVGCESVWRSAGCESMASSLLRIGGHHIVALCGFRTFQIDRSSTAAPGYLRCGCTIWARYFSRGKQGNDREEGCCQEPTRAEESSVVPASLRVTDAFFAEDADERGDKVVGDERPLIQMERRPRSLTLQDSSGRQGRPRQRNRKRALSGMRDIRSAPFSPCGSKKAKPPPFWAIWAAMLRSRTDLPVPVWPETYKVCLARAAASMKTGSS